MGGLELAIKSSFVMVLMLEMAVAQSLEMESLKASYTSSLMSRSSNSRSHQWELMECL